jgi:hypothetical protein
MVFFFKNHTKNRLGLMNFDLIMFIWIYKLIRGCFMVRNIFIEISIMFFRVSFYGNKLKIILKVSKNLNLNFILVIDYREFL